jgi:hypothetical protein
MSQEARTVVVEICKQRKMLDVQKRGCFRQDIIVSRMQQETLIAIYSIVLEIALRSETVWKSMRFKFGNGITKRECTVNDR